MNWVQAQLGANLVPVVKIVAALLVLLPILSTLLLLVWSFFGWAWREEWIDRWMRTLMGGLGFLSLCLVLATFGRGSVPLYYGDLIDVGDVRVGLYLEINPLALTFLMTSGFIAAIVGYFSSRYLHSDPGFLRYFILYNLFVSGLNLALLAGGLLIFVVGWEFVGLSSVLLVAFYRERVGPVAGAKTVFTAYRIGDMGLHGLAMLLPFWLGTDRFPSAIILPLAPHTETWALVCGLLILWAAACKSAQGPFGLWLPKAMEGPTSSSAIFYGALSVHLGVFFLMRTAPLWRSVSIMPWLIVGLGLLTALYAATVGRTRTDVKSLLAYASMAQLGLMFAEVGLGFDQWALWHMVGHGMVRTLQFLRAPSAISDWQRFGRASIHNSRDVGVRSLESRLGLSRERQLYRWAMTGWGLERIVTSVLVGPLVTFGEHLDRASRGIARRLDRMDSVEIVEEHQIHKKNRLWHGTTGVKKAAKL